MKLQFLTLPVATIVAFSLSAVLSHRLAIQATAASSQKGISLSERTAKVPSSSLSQLENRRNALSRAQQFSLEQIKNLISNPDSSLVSGSSAWLLRAIAQERWANQDPATSLDWCLDQDSPYHDPNLKSIIGEQPDLISAFLSSKKPLDRRISLFSVIASLNPDFAIQELPALLTTNTTQLRNLYYPLYNLGKTRMAELEALLKSLGPDHRSPLADAVFTNKLRSNFAKGFQELTQRPDGYEIFFHSHYHDHTANPAKLKNGLSDLPESWRRRIAKSPNALFNALGMNQDRLNIDWQELGFSGEQATSQRSPLPTTTLSPPAFSAKHSTTSFSVPGNPPPINGPLVSEISDLLTSSRNTPSTSWNQTHATPKRGSTHSPKEKSDRKRCKMPPFTGPITTPKPVRLGSNQCAKQRGKV